MKKLAVIGSNGMLGSDLVRFFAPHFSITPISKENYSDFMGKRFDIVINANGNSKRFWANKNILEDFNLSTLSVYKSIFDFKFENYIYISSSDVYENHESTASTNESRKIDSSKLSPYGFHKYIGELIIKKHAKNYLILRCSMMLGKNLKKGPVYDIMNNKSLFITNDSRLQMINTKEISKVIAFLIKKKITNTVFNLGGRGTVDFKKIDKYFKSETTYSEDAKRQIYEMNINRLNKIFPLKTSQDYLQEYLG